VLDPSPLAGSLDRWIDWRRLEHNMWAGHADAVCVVATMLSAGKPVGFVTTDRQVPSHAGRRPHVNSSTSDSRSLLGRFRPIGA